MKKRNYSINLIMESFLNEDAESKDSELGRDPLKSMLNHYNFKYYGPYSEATRYCIDRDFKALEIILKKASYDQIKNKPVYVSKGVKPKSVDELMNFYDKYEEDNPDAEYADCDTPPGSEKDRHENRIPKKDTGPKGNYKLLKRYLDKENSVDFSKYPAATVRDVPPEDKKGDKKDSDTSSEKASSTVDYYSPFKGNYKTASSKLNKIDDSFSEIVDYVAKMADELGSKGALGGVKALAKDSKSVLSSLENYGKRLKTMTTIFKTGEKGKYSQKGFDSILSQIDGMKKRIKRDLGWSDAFTVSKTSKFANNPIRSASKANMLGMGGEFESAFGKSVVSLMTFDVTYDSPLEITMFSEDLPIPFDNEGKELADWLSSKGTINIGNFSLEPKFVVGIMPASLHLALDNLTSSAGERFESVKDDTASYLIVWEPASKELKESLGLSHSSLLRRKYRMRY